MAGEWVRALLGQGRGVGWSIASLGGRFLAKKKEVGWSIVAQGERWFFLQCSRGSST